MAMSALSFAQQASFPRLNPVPMGPDAPVSVTPGAFAAPQKTQAVPLTAEERLGLIRAAIKSSGAKWQAGETSVSKLSREEQLHRVGMNFEKLKASPVKKAMLDACAAASLPATVDWRDVNGNDFVTPARDQGNCGACWSFSMTGGLESYSLIQGSDPDADINLSEQILISCGGIGSCDGAGGLNADYLVNTGLPPESYYPYTASNGSCSGAQSGWQDHTYKIGSWGSVDQSVDALKQAVAAYGPIPAGFIVYADFMNYQSGVYSYTTGEKEGGHAILVVGYSDEGQYFIVKNSWGADWGENGFFRIAYSQVADSNVQFGLSAIAYQSGTTGVYAQGTNYADLLKKSKFDLEAARKRIKPVINLDN